MGLLQQAVKTYDIMDKIGLIGKYEEKKEPFAPIGHIVTKANILVTINEKGDFISAEKIEDKIIIPVTEKSSGRSNSPMPHPLCDNIGYLSGNDEEKYLLYLRGLTDWANSEYSDGKLLAIIKYIENKTLIKDLLECNLIKLDDGKVKNEKDIVCWRVIGCENSSSEKRVFRDVELMIKYKNYYLEQKNTAEKEVCFVTGDISPLAMQHLKGVVSLNGNAKIISANDSTNFTYRGRFTEANQALTVGYLSSQKAHNAIKWLVSNQKVSYGNRVFVCWNPNGKEILSVQSPIVKRNSEKKIIPSDYSKELNAYIFGSKRNMGDEDDIIIVSFDAATTGRLSISYYNELKESDYIDRLKRWDEKCCWYDNEYGTYTPGLFDIINCAFGYQRGGDENSKFETDEKILSQQMQSIISCRVDGKKIPLAVVANLVNKTNNLQLYNKFNKRLLLFTTCAVLRKSKYDYKKEEWKMALEPEKKDRSYQYGRLLAILEKIEKDTYEKNEKRETNAIRMQSVFVKRPAYVTRMIIEQLKNSYYPKLKAGSRIYYDNLIGQIMDSISLFEKDYNKPLDDTYIMGYYLQKNNLYTKNDENKEDNEDE